jgi:gliding motility-associated-like protein
MKTHILKYCKRLFLLLLLFSTSTMGWTQNEFYNDGADVYIQAAGLIYVQGEVINDDEGANVGNMHNSGDVQLEGNWTNNSATSNVYQWNDPGTTTFLGNNAVQTIGGATDTYFNNFTVNKPGNTEVRQLRDAASDQTGVFQLNNDFVNTQTFIFAVFNPAVNSVQRTGPIAAPFTNSTTEGYVSSDGAGYFSRATAAGITYFFPTGTAARFRPAEITSTAISNSYGARFVDAATHDLLLKDPLICEIYPNWYHKLYRTIALGSPENITIYPDFTTDGLLDINYTGIAEWDGALWRDLQPTANTLNVTPTLSPVSKVGYPGTYATPWVTEDFALTTLYSPPQITCPANISVNNDAGICGAVVNFVPPVGTSNCGAVPVTVQTTGLGSGSTFPIGVTTNTFVVTDGGGQTASCSFTVTVTDNENPTITCPANQAGNVDASCNFTLLDYTGLATTGDNCPGETVTQAPPAATVVGAGSTTITLTVTDASGNTANCTFDVVVSDNTDPTITCPANQVGSVDASCNFTLLDYTGLATTGDNCPGETVAQAPPAGTVVGVGSTTITLTVTDAVGNTADCTFDVVVSDNIIPTITCPANQAGSVDASCNFTLLDYTGLATSGDNCPGETVAQAPPAGTVVGVGSTTITLTVTDAVGNTADCTFDVVVSDNIIPTIACPANQAGSVDASCNFTLLDYTGLATSGDNCPGETVSQAPPAGTVVGAGSTTVTLTVTDAVGNTANCTFDVVVSDNTDPTITCPANQTGNVDASCNFTLLDYTGLATTGDNCPGETVAQAPPAGTIISGSGTVQTITLTVTDAAGNTADCTFDVTLDDVTPPTVTCPANSNENVDANCDFTIPDYTGSATITDNCDPAPVVVQVPPAGTVISGHNTVQTITITATDADGNSANCTFDITLQDVTAPTITCPGNQTETPDAACQFTLVDYTGLAVTADNCAGAVTVAQTPPPATVIVGTTTITLTATDAAGNTASCTFDVLLDDTTPPTITCPGNTTENVDANCDFTLPDYTGLATANDNCGVPTVTQAPPAGTIISGSGTMQTITLTATDANGNTADCTFDVTLDDVTPPTVTCPANSNENVDANCDFTIPDYTGSATITDNCDPAPVVVQAPPAGTVISGHGTVQTITITATDADGNSANCTFDITLQDVTAPTITCPGNQTETPDASCQFTLLDYTGLAVTADNCAGAVTVAQTPPATTVIVGTTTITLTATDAAGNTASCTFDVVLDDTTPPTITCPGNTTENVDANCDFTLPDYTGLATANDNCGVPTVTQAPPAGTVISGSGTVQTITLTATDANGNSANCTFDVTLADVTPPSVTCPANSNENVDANCDFTIPDYTGSATITDNCDPAPVVVQAPPAGTIISGHNTVQTITITATDADGNSANCTFDITLQDVTAPTITCPGNQTETPDASCQFTLLDYTALAVTADNCGGVTVTQSPAAASVIVGTTTITLTATDAAGNTANCTFDVVLDDTTPPTITCPGNTTENVDANCDFTLPDYTGLATATDNCGAPTVTQAPPAGTVISGSGTVQTITLTATDANGNSANCTFDVTLADVTPPSVTCPANSNENVDANCDFTIPDYTGTATITDNCDPAPAVVQIPPAGTVISGHGTVQTITITATDADGNSANCTFDITLQDVTPPSLTCPGNQTETPDAACQFVLPDYTALAVSSDNCSVPTVTQSPIAGTTITGTSTITFTATDAAGNTSSCTFDVVLDDTTLPTITCPGNSTENVDANCDFTLPDYTGLATAADNCGAPTVTQSPIAGTVISGHGTVQTITLIATDGNGNTASCTFDVTLQDVTAPTITCPATQTENADATCQFTLLDYTGMATAADNCGTTNITQAPIAGTIVGTGITTITLTVDDGNGNTANCTFDVDVIDATAPTVTCPGNQTETPDASCNFTLPDYTSLAVAADNCDPNPVVTQSPAAGTIISGTTTITITVTDASGNTSSCTFDVALDDTTPPVITCPGDISQCDPVVFWTAPIGTDNCAGVNTAQTDATGLSSGSTFPVGTTTIEYTATDGAGNTTICTFDVTVFAPTTVADAGLDESICDTIVGFTLSGNTPGVGETGTWVVTSGTITVDSPNDPNSVISGLSAGTHTLEWTITGTACAPSTAVVTITITECADFEISIPTGFTPDGDGVNDTWNIQNIEFFPNTTVHIYNRWGNLIFESKGYQEPWDGTYKGQDLPTGSYSYILNLNDGSDPYAGSITIIR